MSYKGHTLRLVLGYVHCILETGGQFHDEEADLVDCAIPFETGTHPFQVNNLYSPLPKFARLHNSKARIENGSIYSFLKFKRALSRRGLSLNTGELSSSETLKNF